MGFPKRRVVSVDSLPWSQTWRGSPRKTSSISQAACGKPRYSTNFRLLMAFRQKPDRRGNSAGERESVKENRLNRERLPRIPRRKASHFPEIKGIRVLGDVFPVLETAEFPSFSRQSSFVSFSADFSGSRSDPDSIRGATLKASFINKDQDAALCPGCGVNKPPTVETRKSSPPAPPRE